MQLMILQQLNQPILRPQKAIQFETGNMASPRPVSKKSTEESSLPKTSFNHCVKPYQKEYFAQNWADRERNHHPKNLAFVK